MKKYLYLLIGASLALGACDDALDTTNYTQKNTGTFPTNLTDAQQMLTGIYANLNQAISTPQTSFYYLSMLASDDNLGGGGSNDGLMQAMDLLTNYGYDMTESFWQVRYEGVGRANAFIESLDNCQDISEADHDKLLGEALFLRAFFYYELASQYGSIPLMTTLEAEDKPQATAAETWGQILQDLKNACDLLPNQRTDAAQAGHVDKYAAEAMLGRAWLFYTGMYCNGEELADLTSTTYNPLTEVTLPDGSTLTKQQVIDYIDDCVNNSGYSLVTSDFRNLWAYTNRCTVEDFPYTQGQGLSWVENDNAINPEALFMIKFNKQGTYVGSGDGYPGMSNQYALHFGIRGGQNYANTFPFGQGWGAGPVAPNLVADWEAAEPNDPRRAASIYDVDDLPNYERGAGGWNDYMQETGYFNMKSAPISCRNTDSESFPGMDYLPSFEFLMYGASNWQYSVTLDFGNIHDLVLIRFADVLLMQSELEEDATGMNRVRARVGLPPVSYSLEALQNERRWELAFEGVRWNDIRRWHIAAAALEKQQNVDILINDAIPTQNVPQNGGYAQRYNETAGFLKIPESQVSLSEHLEQNPGWGSNADYTGWRQ